MVCKFFLILFNLFITGIYLNFILCRHLQYKQKTVIFAIHYIQIITQVVFNKQICMLNYVNQKWGK